MIDSVRQERASAVSAMDGRANALRVTRLGFICLLFVLRESWQEIAEVKAARKATGKAVAGVSHCSFDSERQMLMDEVWSILVVNLLHSLCQLLDMVRCCAAASADDLCRPVRCMFAIDTGVFRIRVDPADVFIRVADVAISN